MGYKEIHREIKNDYLPYNLKFLRSLTDHSQDDIAAYLRVVRCTYTCWEAGTHTPSIYSLREIIKFYKEKCNINIDYNMLLSQNLGVDDIEEIKESVYNEKKSKRK